ncbi:hypothetical protein R5R35_012567 [Gryllus longicercus]|uniref:Uncharacterized protein n=1 Tax=Gryllus longicercus TaxID=2509291 RepID=A0AAN9VI11_9ORTH
MKSLEGVQNLFDQSQGMTEMDRNSVIEESFIEEQAVERKLSGKVDESLWISTELGFPNPFDPFMNEDGTPQEEPGLPRCSVPSVVGRDRRQWGG